MRDVVGAGAIGILSTPAPRRLLLRDLLYTIKQTTAITMTIKEDTTATTMANDLSSEKKTKEIKISSWGG